MGIDIRRNIYRPMQDMTFAAGKHLVLPLHDDAITPTLAFGDGNTGFYESVDNVLRIAINGAVLGAFGLGTASWLLTAADSTKVGLKNTIPTATVPNILPNRTDANTGIGRAANDQLSLIAGGIEGLRISEANGVANMNIVCHEGAVVTHNDNVVTLN